jgi:hypothetical protein
MEQSFAGRSKKYSNKYWQQVSRILKFLGRKASIPACNLITRTDVRTMFLDMTLLGPDTLPFRLLRPISRIVSYHTQIIVRITALFNYLLNNMCITVH